MREHKGSTGTMLGTLPLPLLSNDKPLRGLQSPQRWSNVDDIQIFWMSSTNQMSKDPWKKRMRSKRLNNWTRRKTRDENGPFYLFYDKTTLACSLASVSAVTWQEGSVQLNLTSTDLPSGVAMCRRASMFAHIHQRSLGTRSFQEGHADIHTVISWLALILQHKNASLFLCPGISSLGFQNNSDMFYALNLFFIYQKAQYQTGPKDRSEDVSSDPHCVLKQA